MKRTSYQQGTVTRKPRAKGPDVWVFRYMDADNVKRAETLGTVDKFRTKGAARKEADRKLLEINERLAGIKVSGLCDRFNLEGEKKDSDLRPDTFATYKSFLKRVRTELGHWRVDELIRDIEEMENWINGFKTLGTPDRVIPDRMAKGKLIPGKTIPGKLPRPASKKTKKHVKAFLHLLFECAMKWKLVPMQRNPLKGKLIRIKGGKKRVRLANIITRDQWIALTTDSELCSHVRTMIFIAMLLGLRASEILGLRWDDIDMPENGKSIIRIHRSQVGQHTGGTKTEGSEEELPIHEDLYAILEAWREEQTIDGVHTPINGWLFGSILTGRPFWRGTLQQDHLMPAGQKIGIPNLGWHDFRHTYRAMMRELKISLEEQQTLMRHEDIRTTLDYGGKTPAESGRGANARVVEMLRRRA